MLLILFYKQHYEKMEFLQSNIIAYAMVFFSISIVELNQLYKARTAKGSLTAIHVM